MAKNKERLDVLLVQRGLAETRTKAQAIIMSGKSMSRGSGPIRRPCRGAGGGDHHPRRQCPYVAGAG